MMDCVALFLWMFSVPLIACCMLTEEKDQFWNSWQDCRILTLEVSIFETNWILTWTNSTIMTGTLKVEIRWWVIWGLGGRSFLISPLASRSRVLLATKYQIPCTRTKYTTKCEKDVKEIADQKCKPLLFWLFMAIQNEYFVNPKGGFQISGFDAHGHMEVPSFWKELSCGVCLFFTNLLVLTPWHQR